MSTSTNINTKLHDVVANHGYFKLGDDGLSTRGGMGVKGIFRRFIILIKSAFTNSYDKLAVAEAVVKSCEGKMITDVRGNLETLQNRLAPEGRTDEKSQAIRQEFEKLLNPGYVSAESDLELSDTDEVHSVDRGSEEDREAYYLELAGGDQDIVEEAKWLAEVMENDGQIEHQIRVGVRNKFESLIASSEKAFPQLSEFVETKRLEILGSNKEEHTVEKYRELLIAVENEYLLLHQLSKESSAQEERLLEVFKEEDAEIQGLLKHEIANKKEKNGGFLSIRDANAVEKKVRTALTVKESSNARVIKLKSLASVIDTGKVQEFAFYLSNHVGVLIGKMTDERGMLSEKSYRLIKNTIVRAKRLKRHGVNEKEIKASIMEAKEGLLTKSEYDRLDTSKKTRGHTVVFDTRSSPLVRLGLKDQVIKDGGKKDLLTYFNEDVVPALRGMDNEDVMVFLVSNFEESFVNTLFDELRSALQLSDDFQIEVDSEKLPPFDGLVIEMIGSRIPGFNAEVQAETQSKYDELFEAF